MYVLVLLSSPFPEQNKSKKLMLTSKARNPPVFWEETTFQPSAARVSSTIYPSTKNVKNSTLSIVAPKKLKKRFKASIVANPQKITLQFHQINVKSSKRPRKPLSNSKRWNRRRSLLRKGIVLFRTDGEMAFLVSKCQGKLILTFIHQSF